MASLRVSVNQKNNVSACVRLLIFVCCLLYIYNHHIYGIVHFLSLLNFAISSFWNKKLMIKLTHII